MSLAAEIPAVPAVPAGLAPPGPGPSDDDPARRLRAGSAACRLQFTWPGVQKALTPGQRATAAFAFDADAPALAAGKKLLDTRHPAFRAVTAVRTRIVDRWRAATLPYPEPGVRLIRRDDVAAFDAAMNGLRAELGHAVAALDLRYDELKDSARRRLGSLYDPADYPGTLAGGFAVAWDFPSVESPPYLMELAPAVYAAEQARVRSRFEEAVALAESAFAEEFAALVEHLCERLEEPGDGGSPRVFRDSAVGNLHEFFGRFRRLDVGSSDELEALVERAQRAVRGVAPRDLREGPAVRRRVAAALAPVRSSLEGLLVERPRRRILRGASPSSTGGGG